ncbi:MAG: peptidase E [Xenococcaceae cyanobacterium MO_188.B32]|nr:peptidase E [Xenococcaceae cyanobacterium MO_188.B32]
MSNKLPRKQIVAMGGGGWGMEPDNPLLDRYIYGLSDRKEPKICFLPTASGDSEEYIGRFYRHFAPKPAYLSHLSLFKPPTADLETFILDRDIIYVGGGNTKNLIALWKEWQLDTILREAWNRGIILCGLSAGSICWFKEGITDSIPGELTVLSCLGFLSGSNCPHYSDEPKRRPAYHNFLLGDKIVAGYAADDGVALHFIGDRLTNIVSSRPEAKAYRLEKKNGDIIETVITPKYLG